MALTDTTCKNIKPSDKPRKMADGGGLYLEIMPSGSKYWRLKYRFNGKEKRLAFGVYPEVSLKDAREKRDNARKLLSDGVDPSVHKKEKKRISKLNTENTFEAIAREWHELQKKKWTENHAKYVLRRLEADLFPEIGNAPIKDISPLQLLDALRKIEGRGANEIAHRVMQSAGQVFRYAIVTERAERNPTVDLKGALQPVKSTHYAALSYKDLPEFLDRLERNNARLYRQTQLSIKLMLLTFVRTSELIYAKWGEIDFDECQWHIPAERMKMRKSHIVPLAKQSIDILKELHELNGTREWVFPSITNPRKAMSNNTILGALARMGYKGRATGHGFRALAMSTIKEKLGYRHEVIDRQLAHAQRNKIDAAYDRAEFLDDRIKMMQHWADYIEVVSKKSNNVVAGKFGEVV